MQANLIDEDSMIQFQRLLSNKFPSILVVDDEQDDRLLESLSPGMDNDGYDDYSDDDTPVVVDMHDIEASFARSSEAKVRHGNDRYGLPVLVKEAYPLLVAAIQPHEDILMTCARALDEKKDVSLVREAAAYLEEMEEHKS